METMSDTDLRQQNESLRSELGALSEELHQREDMLGRFVKQNKELAGALQAILNDPYTTCCCSDIARAALKKAGVLS